MKFSEFTNVTTAADADQVAGLSGGANSRTALSVIKALFQSSANTASKAPVRGANGDIIIGGAQFDTASTPTLAEGMVRWDATNKCIEYGVSASESISIGQELSIRARNATGSTLANGTPVYIVGATGNRPTIAKADADAIGTSQTLIGLVTDSAGIANNADGRVTVLGLVNDLDTSAYSEGAVVYLSAGTAGTLTATKPTTEGQFVVRVGYVTRSHATQGSILVAPHYQGSVTGDAVMNATTAAAARDAIGAAAALTGGESIFAGWGDSMTAGTGAVTSGGWPGALQTLVGVPVYNGGVGGETSTQIKTRMLAATSRFTNTVVIWAGRNNIAAQATIEADIAAMVAALGHTRYLVLSVTPATSDNATALGQITAINAALSATYGARYVDIKGYLMSDQAFTDSGVTKTGTDTTDIANGFLPTSFRSDATHLNDTGYTLVARKIKETWYDSLDVLITIGQMLASFGEIGGVNPGNLIGRKATLGTSTDTTARLTMNGSSGGGVLMSARRTAGVTTSFDWALAGNGWVTTDVVAGHVVNSITGTGGQNQLWIGPIASSTAVTRTSLFAATSHSSSAGSNVAGVRFDIVGGLGTGTGAPGSILIKVGARAASGSTAQAATVTAMTFEGDSGRSIAGAAVNLKGYTVATLPTGNQGDTAFVTDASAPTWNATLVGGGAVVCKAFYNGSAWVAG